MVTRRTLVAASGLVGWTLGGGAIAQPAEVGGVWHGALSAGSRSLRLRFEIGPNRTVVLSSLDQGGQPIPGVVVSAAPGSVEFRFPVINGRFVGRLSGPGVLSGTWTQGQDLPLTLLAGEPPAMTAALPQVFLGPAEPMSPRRLEELRAADGLPALAAAARHSGDPPRFWSTGVRRAGQPDAVTDQDLWHIGSQTKSMTATLVARLVEAGRLHWDNTVGDLLAGAAPGMLAPYRDVTFRHLLSHRSGLPGDLPGATLASFGPDTADPRQERRTYVRAALGLTPLSAPGAAFSYANNGYVVAGAMLEARLGESWETLMRRHVFEPLGLGSAGFGPPGRAGAVEQPFGHATGPSGPSPIPDRGGLVDNPAVLGPAGRVHIGLADLLTYLSAHQARTSFLRPETWDTLHSPPFGGDYAMGWVVRPGGVRWHNGSNTLWYSEMAFGPDDGLCAAAVANFAGEQRAVPRALAEAALAVRPVSGSD